MDDVAYREAFRGSAMKRAKLAGLQRNARVVLANTTPSTREPYDAAPPDERTPREAATGTT
jgi:epoxyqueuosine reductase QueG